eukprot:scaffold10327_cov122-Isochrysis_galbana.AAC.4
MLLPSSPSRRLVCARLEPPLSRAPHAMCLVPILYLIHVNGEGRPQDQQQVLLECRLAHHFINFKLARRQASAKRLTPASVKALHYLYTLWSKAKVSGLGKRLSGSRGRGGSVGGMLGSGRMCSQWESPKIDTDDPGTTPHTTNK